MNRAEKERLAQRYAAMSDEELATMLAEDKSGYEPEAYDVLSSEARRRGIGSPAEAGTAPAPRLPPDHTAADGADAIPAYIQILILNSPDDRTKVQSLLQENSIPYLFEPLSISRKELPVSLLVDEASVERAVRLLTDRAPGTGIALW